MLLWAVVGTTETKEVAVETLLGKNRLKKWGSAPFE